jgi:hypothetical protein
MMRLCTFVVASFSAVAFAACGGTGTTATPPISAGGGTATSTLTRSVELGPQPTLVDSTATRAQKIYVSINPGSGLLDPGVVTYTGDGSPTTPTLTLAPGGVFFPGALAVDAAGRIYLVDYGEGSAEAGGILIFASSGTLLAGLGCAFPAGVAVDRYSNAYASCVYTIPTGSFFGAIYRYTANATELLITGIHPGAIAVNVDGSKIYVQVGSTIQTYASNGALSAPTIAHLDQMTDLTVDAAGKIYVATGAGAGTNGSITTYTSNGVRTRPTITAGINYPVAVAVDATGKIFVANAGSASVTTYTPQGRQTRPTITGLNDISGIAVH